MITLFLVASDCVTNSKAMTEDYQGKDILKYPLAPIEGVLNLMFIIAATGLSNLPIAGINSKINTMFRNKGYSYGQIRNLRSAVALMAAVTLLQVLANFFLHFHDDDDEKIKEMEFEDDDDVLQAVDNKYSKIELMFSDFMNDLALKTKRSLSRHGFKFTDNDDFYLYDPEYLKYSKYIFRKDAVPRRAYQLTDLFFVLCGRMLFEQRSYIPIYTKDMFKEYSGLLGISIPGLSATMSIYEKAASIINDPYGDDVKAKYAKYSSTGDFDEGVIAYETAYKDNKEKIKELEKDMKHLEKIKYRGGARNEQYKASNNLLRLIPFIGDATYNMYDGVETFNNFNVYRGGTLDRTVKKINPADPDSKIE